MKVTLLSNKESDTDKIDRKSENATEHEFAKRRLSHCVFFLFKFSLQLLSILHEVRKLTFGTIVHQRSAVKYFLGVACSGKDICHTLIL